METLLNARSDVGQAALAAIAHMPTHFQLKPS